jgi:hypothetical protein
VSNPLFTIAGAVIGAQLGRKYLSGFEERPVTTMHVGDDTSKPALSISRCFWRGKTFYRLYLIESGTATCVGETPHYADVLALIQRWERYLLDGGTVQAWRSHHTQREAEVDDLESKFAEQTRGQFVCGSDGTVTR